MKFPFVFTASLNTIESVCCKHKTKLLRFYGRLLLTFSLFVHLLYIVECYFYFYHYSVVNFVFVARKKEEKFTIRILSNVTYVFSVNLRFNVKFDLDRLPLFKGWLSQFKTRKFLYLLSNLTIFTRQMKFDRTKLVFSINTHYTTNSTTITELSCCSLFEVVITHSISIHLPVKVNTMIVVHWKVIFSSEKRNR